MYYIQKKIKEKLYKNTQLKRNYKKVKNNTVMLQLLQQAKYFVKFKSE